MKSTNAVTGGSSVLVGILYWTVIHIVIFVIATFVWRRRYEWARDPASKLPLPPGCMGFPLVGETISLLTQGADYYLSRREMYGCVYKTHLLGQPTVRIIGAQNIRHIVMGEHITVQSSWPASVKALMGPGSLLNSSPDDHRVRKKLLLQALAPNAVARHVPDIQGFVREHIREWCGQGEMLGSVICKRLAMSMATNVLIGFRVDSHKLQSIIDDFNIFVGNLFSLPWTIPGFGLAKGLNARSHLIAEIKERLVDETSEWSLIDDLKKEDQTSVHMTKEEIVDAILELWFAGNDTSSSTACSTLLALGRDLRVQDKIAGELGQYNLMDPDTELTFDLLGKLTYVNHVVKEVLRLYPPVGGGFRKTKTLLEIGGYQIPKGWKVIYSIRDTHQTTELFTEREKFLPERWSQMEEATLEIGNRFHYLPFGAGARACPGEKFAKTFLKIFIVELIRSCRWELKNKTPKMLYIPVTRPADKLPVTFAFKD